MFVLTARLARGARHGLPVILAAAAALSGLIVSAGPAAAYQQNNGTLSSRYVYGPALGTLSPNFYPTPGTTMSFTFKITTNGAVTYGFSCSDGSMPSASLASPVSNAVETFSAPAPSVAGLGDIHCAVYATTPNTYRVFVATGGTYTYYRPDPLKTTVGTPTHSAVNGLISLAGVPSSLAFQSATASTPTRVILPTRTGSTSAGGAAVTLTLKVLASATASAPGAAVVVPQFPLTVKTNNANGYRLSVATQDLTSTTTPTATVAATLISYSVTRGSGNTAGIIGGGAVTAANTPLTLGTMTSQSRSAGDSWYVKLDMTIPTTRDATYVGYIYFTASTL